LEGKNADLEHGSSYNLSAGEMPEEVPRKIKRISTIVIRSFNPEAINAL
jgi:hypothetical protein